jgi:VanZ family protein
LKQARTRWLRVLPAVLYALGVFYAGVIDLGPLPEAPGLPTDKLLHVGAFFGLELTLEWAFLQWGARRRRWVAVGLSVATGLALELVQAAVPHRSAELLDLFADTCGALLAAATVACAGRWAARRAQASVNGQQS